MCTDELLRDILRRAEIISARRIKWKCGMYITAVIVSRVTVAEWADVPESPT